MLGVVEFPCMWGLEPVSPFLLFYPVLDIILDGYVDGVDGSRADVRKLGLCRRLLIGTTTGFFAPLPNSLPCLPHDFQHHNTTHTNTTTHRPRPTMFSSAVLVNVVVVVLSTYSLTMLLFIGFCALVCSLGFGFR